MKKDILLVVLVLVSVGMLAVLIHFSEKDNKLRKSLDEQLYSRMVAEESLQKNAAKLATLEAQLKQANDKMIRLQRQMEEEKSANYDLQKQYKDLNNIKAALESRLQEVVEANVDLPASAAP